MSSRTRQPRVDERFALETIKAVEDVVSHRWLEAAGGPTPDLEMTLRSGLTVTVEITMSTDAAERSLRASFNNRWWPNASLTCEWWVSLADFPRETRGRRRNVQALMNDLVSVLQNFEGRDCEPDELCGQASRAVAGFGQPDWDSIGVIKCDPVGRDTGGGIRTWVAPFETGWLEALDELVEAVQERIDDKTEQGQLKGYASPKWLVVVLDGGIAAMQLEDAFGSKDSPRRPAEIDGIACRGFDEVWAVGQCFSQRSHRNVLRLFAWGRPWAWQSVENDAWLDELLADSIAESQCNRILPNSDR